jgi:polyisoprenoid-binding protein YceI
MKLGRIIIGLIVIGVLAVGGAFAYIWFSGGSGEVSEDIDEAAVRIEDAEGTVFQIVPEDSEVRFTLNEDLRGNRNTVIGRTTQVGGDIVINFENPRSSAIGTIRVNARSLTTDDEMRNRAIRSTILRSSSAEFEFIDFTPTSISGLPESITLGETYTLEITGDLLMLGQSHPATFTAEVSIESASRISGRASTTVSYGDWGIPVPTAPGVANVEPEALLEIDFEAAAQ